MMTEFYNQMLAAQIPPTRLLQHEPMSRHTTFRVGGPADLLYKAESAAELAFVLNAAQVVQLPCTIIGNGSNLLVRDGGIRGLVVQLGDCMRAQHMEGDVLHAQAGCLLSALASTCLANSLSGMEALSGIPGTLGGAIAMNAGAYGGEMSQVVISASVLRNGEVYELSNAELELGYRTSIIQKTGLIVLDAKLQLKPDSRDAIKARMDDFTNRRRTKQPLAYPSAGSTFKRPAGHFAGALIQDAQLKGVRVGGAQVSELHAGFIVNTGNASAADIIELIELVQQRVFEHSGVHLEPEVKIIGEAAPDTAPQQ